jgi:protein TonB
MRHLPSERLRAAAGVALLHLLLGYLFISGLGVPLVRSLGEELKLFNVPQPPPPPPLSVPAKEQVRAEEGAAAPPSLKAQPSPVVAPPPRIQLPVPPPVVASPKPTENEGADISAGAATIDGPGTGAGGQGEGTGSGGRGSGSGSGFGRAAQLIRGGLRNSDYPRSALRAGVQGSVSVRFTVAPSGRAVSCQVTRSSGHPDLDRTTCRVIEDRFRYRPALGSAGEPVAETVRKTYDWLLRPGQLQLD